jgi:Na+/proline symporter
LLWWLVKNLAVSFAASAVLTILASLAEYYLFSGQTSPWWLMVMGLLWALFLGIALTLDFKPQMQQAQKVSDMENEEILIYIGLFIAFILIILFIVGVIHGIDVAWQHLQTLF